MHEYTGPHDYFNGDYVNQWAQGANTKRPFRPQFFAAFAGELRGCVAPKILELGSGPGFLAEYLLSQFPDATYHLFDFSPQMLELSRTRLARFAGQISFHEGSFLAEDWWYPLPAPFDAIVSMQAIHEVRQAERIPPLYGELVSLLREGGSVLIADQVNGEGKQEAHLLTPAEQIAALEQAGLMQVRLVYAAGDLALFTGIKTP